MSGNFFRYLFIGLFLALFGCQQPASELTPFELKLEKYAGQLKIIKLEKDGQVYSFLYDTGGGYTVLDAAYTETFGCTPYGKTVGFRMNGEQVTSQNCNSITMDFSGISVQLAPKVMDINSFLPEGLPKLAGLISLQTFKDHLVTIDYSRAILTIETAESFAARTEGMVEIPLKVTSELDGDSVTMFTQVLENPEPLWFYLDSGNLRNVLMAQHAANAIGLQDDGALKFEIAGETYETTGEVMDIIYDGSLDVRFFLNYVITLDLENSKAWVKRNPTE